MGGFGPGGASPTSFAKFTFRPDNVSSTAERDALIQFFAAAFAEADEMPDLMVITRDIARASEL